MHPSKYSISAVIALAISLSGINSFGQDQELYKEFKNPPADCHPRVWWHWIDGNISKDGIKKDLLWMKSAGITGVQVFDAGLGVPTIVGQRVPFMSEEWKDAFCYAADLADSLGFEFGAAVAGGWSDTGGPWVEPEDAMKTLNWKEMDILGGRKIETPLPEPNVICGKYLTHSFFAQHKPEYDFYRDIAVIAVKVPEYDKPIEELGVVCSASDGADVSPLLDGDLNNVCRVNPAPDGYAWIQYSFPQKTTIRSFFYARKDDWASKTDRHWEVSDDGISFKPIDLTIPGTNIPYVSLSMPATSGRFFRLVSNVRDEALDYTELRIYPSARVNLGTEKAGFFVSPVLKGLNPTPEYEDATPEDSVLDISDCYKNGILTWEAPEGRWRIYRFGYTLRGRRNNPASPEATGLETDKLDPEATARYYDKYLGMLNEASGEKLGSVLTHLMIDSFEAGCQTWTAKMPEEFSARRGYDMIKWLPALAGQIIGSSDATDRFLQDWRRTLGEMIVDYHYRVLDSILEPYGLKRYTEFHESGRSFPADGFEIKSTADIPMGAFWVQGDSLTHTRYRADIREAASAAHVYGKTKVAAESFTTDGNEVDASGRQLLYDVCPDIMKGGADIAMANGLNTFVIHCSVHQPTDSNFPGVSLSKYGSWFNRHETWSHEAKAWTDYLSRSCYLLRQGKFVADIAYFFSENTNTTSIFNGNEPYVPEGYAFDYVNSSVLALPHFGYKALIMDPSVTNITIESLRSIKRLADGGCIIAGSAPSTFLGLADRSEEFARLVQSIWNSGRSNVVTIEDLADVLAANGIRKDVDFGGADSSNLRFVHRRTDNAEIYFIVNSGPACGITDISFDVCGRKPRILHAEDGSVEDAPYRVEGERTVVSLNLGVRDAQFVVFDEVTAVREYEPATAGSSRILTVSGPWKVDFRARRNSPTSITIEQLSSLSENESQEVKYFSGTARYNNTFRISRLGRNSRYCLNLGEVHSVAHVWVNGTDCGTAWKAPFEVDITDALKKGRNTISIEVTNGWINRMIGDAQPGAEPVTWAEPSHIRASDPLHPSGLIGPVTISCK